jgi:CRISPR-associated exonuclease Cas4
MYAESELLPISGLQHLMFCERQWGLIHIEQQWEENRLTMEGRVLHERVDEAGPETRRDVRIARGLPLRSLRLGLVGRADVVEFHRIEGSDTVYTEARAGNASIATAVPLTGQRGLWRVFPVEYKRGRPKLNPVDEVQLCAQSLCLEEMLNVQVTDGALFYGQPRRRHDVAFTPALRGQTEALAARMRNLFESGVTPPAVYEKRCLSCSLIDQCLPKTAGASKSARTYLSRSLAAHQGAVEETDA